MASSQGYHEPIEKLSESTMDRHRAVASLQEELEAVDWYDQRIDATSDPALRKILEHNRDEEKEHAAMTLEWLRRRDPGLDAALRTYLFTDGDITEIEEAVESGGGGAAHRQGDEKGGRGGAASPDGSLGIGSLRHHAGVTKKGARR